ARRQLVSDLRPLAALAGSDEGRSAARPAPSGARAYAEERFVARLGEPLTAEIARAANVMTPPRASSAVRAVLADRSLGRILEAAIDGFAAALAAESARVEPVPESETLEHRAEALRRA